MPTRELQPYVEQLSEVLVSVALDEEDASDAAATAWDLAIRVATSFARRREPDDARSTSPATFASVIGSNLKALRTEANCTQAALAEAMTALGFEWKRITCAEVELATRRVTIEEVLALAVLFALPAVQLLVPSENTVIAWPRGNLPSQDVAELFVGLGGAVGTGGITWRTAARAVGRPRTRTDGRPAVDLWANRSEGLTQPAQSKARSSAPRKDKT